MKLAWVAGLIAVMGTRAFAQGSQGSQGTAVPAACGVPGAKTVSYLTDPFGKLKDTIPELKGMKFEGGKPGAPDPSADILSKTGAAITAMVPRVPNLVAEEQLTQIVVGLPYYAAGDAQYANTSSRSSGRGVPSIEAANGATAVEGEDLQKALDKLLTTSAKHTTFSYRIRPAEDKQTLEEFRTTSDNEAVSLGDLSPGNPRGVGFSTAWMKFLPANQPESQYRYLGRQKIGVHETYVIAFAQVAEKVKLPGEIRVAQTACPYYTQGVAWIDQTANQVVQLQSDLEAPLSGIEVTRLRSKIHFGEVRIEERNLTLWLPSDVEIVWMAKKSAGGEMHRYSRYRLFGAQSKIGPAKQE